MEIGGSEGTRWAGPAEVTGGADQRANLAAKHIPPGASMIALGAGARRLGAALQPGGAYLPIDLVRFAEGGEVLDLNQGQLPERTVDVVAALDLLQYIHDVPALLARCHAAAPNLILRYPLAATEEKPEDRRAQGWFNAFYEETLSDMLKNAGWSVTAREPAAASMMFVCQRAAGVTRT